MQKGFVSSCAVMTTNGVDGAESQDCIIFFAQPGYGSYSVSGKVYFPWFSFCFSKYSVYPLTGMAGT